MKTDLETKINTLKELTEHLYWFDMTKLYVMHSQALLIAEILENRFNEVVEERKKFNKGLEDALE